MTMRSRMVAAKPKAKAFGLSRTITKNKMPQENERRKSERLQRHFIITYKTGEPQSKHNLSQIKNISQGGMYFATAQQYHKDTLLDIEIQIPLSPNLIRLKGKVVGCEPVVTGLIYNTHISYFDIDRDTQELLLKVIQFFNRSAEIPGF